MSDPVPALVVDLLEWLGPQGKPYHEVMDAWRTSCPRLPVWETANEQGLIDHLPTPGARARIAVSDKGREFLAARGGADRTRAASSSPRGAALICVHERTRSW
ncbi:MAG: 3-phosphoglycerate dehydrogenase [Proteobacteria bacterium]|nr:3-phosphoglycerate dehydrogenase [Pseudomonadota bacterium]